MNCSCRNRKSDYFGVICDCKYSENNLAAKMLGNTIDRIIMVIKTSGVNLNLSSNESRKGGLKRQFQMSAETSL